MFVHITPQNLSASSPRGSAHLVNYLEKENQGLNPQDREYFFNQTSDRISAKEVIQEIDANTKKVQKKAPKYYSITLSPSKYELSHLQNSSGDLKRYTRELMKDYVSCFNRELNGRPVTVNDIKFYAKVEHQRIFKWRDKEVRENQPIATKIDQLKKQIRKIELGEIQGNLKDLNRKIINLEKSAPHQRNGERICKGMQKAGMQSHVHIIMSRKDKSNTFGLSPGSKCIASESVFRGKIVKQGFHRDAFFLKAEKTFDRTFGYKRNFVETYQVRKTAIKDPKLYFSSLMGLPTSEKAVAFNMLRKAGIPVFNIPTNKVQLAIRAFHKVKSGFEIAAKSAAIEI